MLLSSRRGGEGEERQTAGNTACCTYLASVNVSHNSDVTVVGKRGGAGGTVIAAGSNDGDGGAGSSLHGGAGDLCIASSSTCQKQFADSCILSEDTQGRRCPLMVAVTKIN